MNRILAFFAAITLANIFIYIAAPSELLALSFQDFQPWQLLTFQFTHFGVYHLLENLVGLALVSGIAYELDVDFRRFLLIYFLSVFIAIPVLFLFPTSAIAGNSTGIYGLLALNLRKARKYVKEYITVPLFSLFIFSSSFINSLTCPSCLANAFRSDFFHFSGFVAGLLGRFIRLRKKRALT